MWPSRLFWKIFCVYAGLSFTMAAGLWGLLAWWQRPFVVAQVEERLRETGLVLRAVAEPHMAGQQHDELQSAIRRLAQETQLRLTVISPTGEVWADSHEDPRRMGNHMDRPEIQRAAGPAALGVDQRGSSTLGVPMLYVALPIEHAGQRVGFVRVAAETKEIDRQIAAVQKIGLAAAFVLLLLVLLATYFIVERITRPITELTTAVAELTSSKTPPPIVVQGTDEVATLGTTFNAMRRQLAERLAELHENNARLADVMGNMAEGVLAIDARERVLLANEASRRLLEFGPEDVVGRPLWELTRQRALPDAVADALRTGGPCEREFETTTAARRVLTLRATRLPGEPSPGVMIVLHDVTELRRLENLRREFVANVSHELKTPLSAIKAYAETLRLGAVHDAENNLAFVARIEEQADRLHQLILDLLQLARVESGQEVYDITSVPLREAVDTCVAEYQNLATAKQVTLDVEPSEVGLCVQADEEGLYTILSNLVDNAIKYTPDGGRVSIRWRREGGQAVLEVQDTGIGIPKQHQSRVFERFYRVDKARSRELGGTGLGLSIVKHLAQAFGGSVGIESQPRAGSTFRVTLPVAMR